MIQSLRQISTRKLALQPFRLEQRCPTISLSTAAATSVSLDSSKSFFKTSETNPNNLNERHLGRFYSISDDVYKKVFDHTRHHGFPLYFRDQCQVFRENCIMVRKPFLDLKKCVDAINLEKPVVRFVVYGPQGSGRSMIVSSMVHYGFVNDYILVHHPWVPLWGVYFKEIVPSSIREGFFDHTVDSVTWLTKFKTQNSELIKRLNLVTEKEYQWTKREVTPTGSSILDIVEHGITRPAHATECMGVLFQELKDKSSQQKCKTMVVLDGVNHLFYECKRLFNPTNKREILPVSKLTAYTVLKDLLRADWSGGVIITTVDTLAAPDFHRESTFPRYLLKKEGWEILDPFVPIEVTNYSSQEVQTTIDYFLERKWLAHPGVNTEAGRMEIEYLSTRNPFALVDICKSR